MRTLVTVFGIMFLLGSLTPPNLKNATKPLQAYIFLSNFMLLRIGFLVFLWYNRRWR